MQGLLFLRHCFTLQVCSGIQILECFSSWWKQLAVYRPVQFSKRCWGRFDSTWWHVSYLVVLRFMQLDSVGSCCWKHSQTLWWLPQTTEPQRLSICGWFCYENILSALQQHRGSQLESMQAHHRQVSAASLDSFNTKKIFFLNNKFVIYFSFIAPVWLSVVIVSNYTSLIFPLAPLWQTKPSKL